MADRIDLLRRALAGATRALAADAEADVVFASEAGASSGKTARVPSPGPGLEPRLVAEARGAADSLALRLRFHDQALGTRTAPADSEARAVFDALETARIEALGARAMSGVRSNLAHLAEARVRGDSIVRARTVEEVPLATAVGLLARERLTGEAPPHAAADGLKLIAPWIEERAAAELDALALTIDDQSAFATLSRRLLEDLDLAVAAEDAEDSPDNGDGSDEDQQGSGEDDGEDGDQGPPDGGDVEARDEEGDEDSEQKSEEGETGEQDGAPGDEVDSDTPAAHGRRNWDLAPETQYKPFTTRFDEVIEAKDLCEDEELGRLRAYLDQQMGG
ncbi:MAG: cobaltochelatase subunit CobT, partial [Sphingomicrobium sp.]